MGDWLAYRHFDGRLYYYRNGKSSWKKPPVAFSTALKVVNDSESWQCYRDTLANKLYYFNIVTEECCWDCPPGCRYKTPINQSWRAFLTKNNERYYHNSITNETTYDTPQGGLQLAIISSSTEEEMVVRNEVITEHDEEDDDFYIPNEELLLVEDPELPVVVDEVPVAVDKPSLPLVSQQENYIPVQVEDFRERIFGMYSSLLDEKGIQPFSQWSEKWIAKLENDPRYNIVPIADRAIMFREFAQSLIGKEKQTRKRRIDACATALSMTELPFGLSSHATITMLETLKRDSSAALAAYNSMTILTEEDQRRAVKKWSNS